MATCHHLQTEWMVPHMVDRKRASTIGSDHSLEKRAKLCTVPSSFHAEIAHIVHVTRRQSHELTKLLSPSPPHDRRLIRHQLDPSIFDAEVSEDEDDDVHQVLPPRLLPKVRTELQCLLEPRCLDDAYAEGAELVDLSTDGDSDELPDLNDDDDCQDNDDDVDDDDDNNSGVHLDASVARTEQDKMAAVMRMPNGKRKSSSEIVPVLDKLKLLPVVRLTPLEDFRPHITKKLKLKTNGRVNGTSVPQNKFIWNQEHHSRLRSILHSVGQHLSAAKNSSTRNLMGENGLCKKVGIIKPLKIQMTVDKEIAQEQPHIIKPWHWDSDSSDSDSETTDMRWHTKEHKGSCTWQPLCTNTWFHGNHPVHARHVLGGSSSGTTTSKLSQCMVDMLESCDTEDGDFQLRFLRLCHSCLAEWLTWPSVLLQQLFRLVLDGGRASVQWGAYDILCTLLSQAPPTHLPFNWQQLTSTVEQLLAVARDGTKLSLLGRALALQYMVSALEQDVALASSPCRSHAARWFGVDQRYQSACQIILWLLDSVALDESSVSNMARTQPPAPSDLTMSSSSQVPRLVPLLQRLLDLSVTVCSSADLPHIDRFATQISQGYVRLTNYSQRHLLVSTIRPSVITFKLCSRILDNYGCSKSACAVGDSSIAELLDVYSTCMPLSQSVAEDGIEQEKDKEVMRSICSSAAVEEIAFLTWSLISAHVKMNKGKELADVKEVAVGVQRLEDWYRTLTVQLSAKTQLYLKMIECLNTT